MIGEDGDIETKIDLLKVSTAFTRLVTYQKVDFVVGVGGGEIGMTCQDIAAEHKKIYINQGGATLAMSQRVLDDYDKYKYCFTANFNETAIYLGITDSLLLFRENTGFNKVAYLGVDVGWTRGVMQGLDTFLPENGFDLVYANTFIPKTFDFSSYFAAAEAAGAEIMVPLISGEEGIAFVKEWYDRQSPMIIYGGTLSLVGNPEGWESTDGKCEHVMAAEQTIVVGYPLTSKTLETRDSYFQRWGDYPTAAAARAYDIIRFMLPDAIERAGTIETEAVIKALEEMDVETSLARNFVFTDSHGVMMGENPNNPDTVYMVVMVYQWQNGQQVPVCPKKIMEEAGVSYTFPDWPGPWDNIN